MTNESFFENLGIFLIAIGVTLALGALMFADPDDPKLFPVVGAGVALGGLGATLYGLSKKSSP